MSESIYFSGQGIVSVATRDSSGNPLGFTELGNCPALTIKPGSAAIRYATRNPVGPLPFGVPQGDPPSFSLIVEDIRKENLSRFLLSANTDIAGGTLSEPLTFYAGKSAALSHLQVSALSIAGATLGTDYTVDLPTGTVRSITLTGSHTVAYTYGAYKKFAPFTQAPPFVWLRFAGMNTFRDRAPCVVDIYKTRLPPLDKLDFISDDLLSYTFESVMENDPARGGTEADGDWFRIRMV